MRKALLAGILFLLIAAFAFAAGGKESGATEGMTADTGPVPVLCRAEGS